MSSGNSERLALADLVTFDPQHRRRDGGESRACCPLCGTSKPLDAAHRSLAYNTTSGLWNCHRCGAKGLLVEWHQSTDRANLTPWSPPTRGEGGGKLQAQRAAKRRFALPEATPQPVLPAPVPVTPPATSPTPNTQHPAPVPRTTPTRGPCDHPHMGAVRPEVVYRAARTLGGTPGATYLTEKRGLPETVGTAAGIRFLPDFLGRPAVLFPVRTEDGELVAVQGRYIDGRETPRMRTVGERKRGVFATPDALIPIPPPLSRLVIVEAPLDALSLQVAGISAVALCGCEGVPYWLTLYAAFGHVFLAFDADEAGDKAAERLAPEFRQVGATVTRLRPPWAKDWNALLVAQGVEAVRSAVALAWDARFLSPSLLQLADQQQAGGSQEAAVAALYRSAQERTLPMERLILPDGAFVADPNEMTLALVQELRRRREGGITAMTAVLSARLEQLALWFAFSKNADFRVPESSNI